jgi:hypothetical protein
MIVQPFTLCKTISTNELPYFECSDRIMLPKSYYDATGIQENDLLNISNERDQSFSGTMYGAHTENDTIIYVPSWLFSRLDIYDKISISHLQKKRCSAIQIKPHSSAFAKRADFFRALNMGLFYHRSVERGSRIPLFVRDHVEYITIENAIPSDIQTFFMYDCGDIDVQILPALDSEKAESKYLYKSTKKKGPIVFFGTGFVLGGTNPTPMTLMEATAAAAKRRMALIASGKKPY